MRLAAGPPPLARSILVCCFQGAPSFTCEFFRPTVSGIGSTTSGIARSSSQRRHRSHTPRSKPRSRLTLTSQPLPSCLPRKSALARKSVSEPLLRRGLWRSLYSPASTFVGAPSNMLSLVKPVAQEPSPPDTTSNYSTCLLARVMTSHCLSFQSTHTLFRGTSLRINEIRSSRSPS